MCNFANLHGKPKREEQVCEDAMIKRPVEFGGRPGRRSLHKPSREKSKNVIENYDASPPFLKSCLAN